MSILEQLSDLELTALVSSKICHDAIGPVGAINNGLEVLDEENDPDAQVYALDLIRASTQKASAKLQFARFAFGAAGSAGAEIDLSTAEAISQGYVGSEKHFLTWSVPPGYMGKDKVKLLLNLVYGSITALPRGGEISVSMAGTLEQPTFELLCRGSHARLPQHLPEMLQGSFDGTIDAMTVQAYYTLRLAQTVNMGLHIGNKGDDISIVAGPVG